MIWVVIPSYNCGISLEMCFTSVRDQLLSGSEYRVLMIDDASTEQDHIDRVDLWDRLYPWWSKYRSSENMRAPYSIQAGIASVDMAEDDIIFLLDGDDTIPSDALGYIKHIYETYPQFWLTYGNYLPTPPDPQCPPAREYPTLTRMNREFRTHNILFNHPITFRKFLWDQLTDADLLDDKGERYPAGYDQLIMYPMLEMCGPDHYACLEKHLYFYNTTNPLSDTVLGRPGPDIRDRPKRALYTKET